MALRGLFQEAIAKDDAELKQVLEEYDRILTDDPGNMVSILKWLFPSLADSYSLYRNVALHFSRL
jgi:hypothetical protein